ncbi:MAG: hypothetical protein HOA72_23195, partial [Desulfobacula sp.]|uniref:putative molybdenum carrier protein n=2 Tax=Desulfobacula sp. TaxID=2593537 RepID=UPI002A070517|nr:hypothetical protein [Desulfobacula sp.]
MLKKIISGGQTGADQAALDVAIKFNIDHGGWIPRGRRTEKGPLPDKYQLKEMDTTDYRERTKLNIMDSHGTVIIFRGKLTGGSKLTKSYAKVVGKPNCSLDLLNHEEFEAAIILRSFIMENQIDILNVAGPRLSNCPGIYMDVKIVLETMLYLFFLDTNKETEIKKYISTESVIEQFPQTMEDAVDLICNDLPLRTKTFIAKFDPHNIGFLYFSVLEYLRHRLGFDIENQVLLKHCSTIIGCGTCTIEDAVMEILKKIKLHLETDHILRVIK